ncbi:hypothetical protein NPIL_5611 [Nephila pilipes]|uniref:Uncharacterized protein n=1 Tax=Nephila pilipes TaxID=299642 RepID=A0A8X6N7U9_NEPPI|nr:hypothetical protein NPIL_5611 [Nephila pilipes]
MFREERYAYARGSCGSVVLYAVAGVSLPVYVRQPQRYGGLHARWQLLLPVKMVLLWFKAGSIRAQKKAGRRCMENVQNGIT